MFPGQSSSLCEHGDVHTHIFYTAVSQITYKLFLSAFPHTTTKNKCDPPQDFSHFGADTRTTRSHGKTKDAGVNTERPC